MASARSASWSTCPSAARGLFVVTNVSALQVALADDAEEHVGGVGGVALVAELVDDEDVRVDVGLERLLQRPARAARESSPISSSAEVKRASKPFWIAR